MRFRDENNAASRALAAIAFVLVGCVIAVCGVLAGLEGYVVTFGLIAYVLIAGPLFFASFCERLNFGRHKSFRLTPPRYMEGKRLKPRLRLVAYAAYFKALAAALLSYAGQIWAMGRFQWRPAGRAWGAAVFVATPVVVFYFVLIVFRIGAVRLAWMTREEARSFPLTGSRWPETWLEPLDEEDPC